VFPATNAPDYEHGYVEGYKAGAQLATRAMLADVSRAEVVEAITDMQEGRYSHQQWLEHLSNPERDDCKGCDDHAAHIGDAEYHRQWIGKYDRVIRLLARVPLSEIATTGAGEGERRDIWDLLNKRRHELIDIKHRSGVLEGQDEADYKALQHVAGIVRGLLTPPLPVSIAEGEPQDEAAALAAYRQEYERLFNWRDLWNRLSNSKRFKLASQNDRIEEKAARANRLIGKLIADYDASAPTAAPVVEASRDTWISADDRVWERYANITCVECPDCCFRFDAIHQDGDTLGYSCPNCKDRPASTVTPTEAASEIVQEWVAGLDYGSLPPGQISRLTELIAKHFPPTEATQPPYMHEDQLPVNMPKEDYDKWYAQSWIPDRVGCRVGPVYPLVQPAEAGEVERLKKELAEAYYEDCEICEQVIISEGGDKVYTFIVCGRCWNQKQQELTDARTNTISECIGIVNSASVLPFGGVPYINRDEVLATLEALTKGEHQE
jgi:hypothetical protein